MCSSQLIFVTEVKFKNVDILYLRALRVDGALRVDVDDATCVHVNDATQRKHVKCVIVQTMELKNEGVNS